MKTSSLVRCLAREALEGSTKVRLVTVHLAVLDAPTGDYLGIDIALKEILPSQDYNV